MGVVWFWQAPSGAGAFQALKASSHPSFHSVHPISRKLWVIVWPSDIKSLWPITFVLNCSTTSQTLSRQAAVLVSIFLSLLEREVQILPTIWGDVIDSYRYLDICFRYWACNDTSKQKSDTTLQIATVIWTLASDTGLIMVQVSIFGLLSKVMMQIAFAFCIQAQYPSTVRYDITDS